MKEVITSYAEAKASKLYLPPIDEATGRVCLDFYDGEIHWPAGYDGFVGIRKIKYVPQADDLDKPFFYKRKPIEDALPFAILPDPELEEIDDELTPPSFIASGEPIERDRGVSYYNNSKPNSLIGNPSVTENYSRQEMKGLF